MKKSVVVPEIGESVSSGIISAWLKEDGDIVKEGDEIFELETDKATLAVPSPASGKLRIAAQVDDEVEVGAEVGTIDTDAAESSGSSGETKAKEKSSAEKTSADTGNTNDTKGSEDDLPGAPHKSEGLSPAARKMVEEKGMDPSSISGTGPGGIITKPDVLQHMESGKDKSASASSGSRQDSIQEKSSKSESTDGTPRQTRKKMSKIRQRIAANLVASQQNAALLTTFNEADMSAVMQMRSDYKEEFEKLHGVRLGFMSFFIKAAVKALKAYPEVNGFIDQDEVVYNHRYDIGVALSSDRGLITPVIRDADRKSFAAIEEEIIDFAKRARDKKVKPDELTGATFTITNGGVFGSMLSTPIPSPGQSGILGMHSIQQRPVAVDGEVVIKPMMYLALSYDHRIIDGREAIGFLVTIKKAIEAPGRMLIDV